MNADKQVYFISIRKGSDSISILFGKEKHSNIYYVRNFSIFSILDL